MIDDHERLREAIAAYALGALDRDEMAPIELHIDGCTECRQLLDEYRMVGGILPFALSAETPPPRVRDAILAQARASKTGQASPTIVAATAPEKRLEPMLRRLRWAATAVALLGLLAWNLSLQLAESSRQAEVARLQQEIQKIAGQQDSRISLLVNTEPAPGATGRLYLTTGGQQGVLAVSGLPALPPGEVYQFWFARPDKSRDSAGIFKVGANGEALLSVAAPGDLGQYNEIWVTKEPNEGGSEKPTPPHYLEGPLNKGQPF